MTIKLKLATEKDIPLIHQMGNESYRYHFSKLWHQHDELEKYLNEEYGIQRIQADLKDKNIEWFIIRNFLDPKITDVGFIKLTYQAYIPDEVLIGTLINKFYFMPNMTGLGYGKNVFALIEKYAKQKSDRLWLEVLAENHQAIQFYVANGMKVIKEFTFKSATQQSTELIMTKLI